MEKTKIGIAEDHPVTRNGLVQVLELETNFSVVFQSADGNQLMSDIKNSNIDVLLLDISMPVISGLEVLPKITLDYPNIRIIIFSSYLDDSLIKESIEKGARGYLSKNSDPDIIIESIFSVLETGYYFDESISPKLLQSAKYNKLLSEKYNRYDPLTQREKEVMILICEGLTTAQIAKKLFRSDRTIENHRQNLYMKTNSKNVADIIKFALLNGYYRLNS
ncbi:MAG: response regulator transcription factor [Bacteroidetes bacterium]|nr:MAG: response regulator transcription factor [Bacteroidota bacterium]